MNLKKTKEKSTYVSDGCYEE